MQDFVHPPRTLLDLHDVFHVECPRVCIGALCFTRLLAEKDVNWGGGVDGSKDMEVACGFSKTKWLLSFGFPIQNSFNKGTEAKTHTHHVD